MSQPQEIVDMGQTQSTWSEAAQATTRENLTSLAILPTPDSEIALKHSDGAFATLAEDDLLAGRFRLTDRRSGEVSNFASVDDLIGAGWVLD